MVVGVLWKKSKNGMDYFSGVLKDLHGTINIAVFPNNRKENDKQPDFNIVVSFNDKRNSDISPVGDGDTNDEIPF